MKRCIDTCAYSRLMLGAPGLQACLEEADVLIVPVIVLGELHTGFDAGTRVKENEERLNSFLESPGVRVQDITWDIARRYAILVNELRRKGTPIPTNDIWIASTALEFGARLITYDSHFKNIPGLIVDVP
ncbi:MAG: type II toxin-antitoxin system VapC family toxin [bacterium]